MSEINLHQELDDMIDSIRAQQLEASVGQTSLEAVLKPIVRETYQGTLRREVAEWAIIELDRPKSGAIARWRKYNDLLDNPVPASTGELLNDQPQLIEQLNYLYDARQKLNQSQRRTEDCGKVGDSMRLVIVPWQDFLENIHDVQTWLFQLRHIDGTFVDTIDGGIRKYLEDDTPIYRDYTDPSNLISVDEYLRQQIERDGPWGLRLIQTSHIPGLKRQQRRRQEKSVDSLTARGKKHYEIDGQPVDALGFIEWEALTLQDSLPYGMPKYHSFMLANRNSLRQMQTNFSFIGAVGGSEILSMIVPTGLSDRERTMRPRLAVMAPPGDNHG